MCVRGDRIVFVCLDMCAGIEPKMSDMLQARESPTHSLFLQHSEAIITPHRYLKHANGSLYTCFLTVIDISTTLRSDRLK